MNRPSLIILLSKLSMENFSLRRFVRKFVRKLNRYLTRRIEKYSWRRRSCTTSNISSYLSAVVEIFRKSFNLKLSNCNETDQFNNLSVSIDMRCFYPSTTQSSPGCYAESYHRANWVPHYIFLVSQAKISTDDRTRRQIGQQCNLQLSLSTKISFH